eukprot:gene24700-10643_t
MYDLYERVQGLGGGRNVSRYVWSAWSRSDRVIQLLLQIMGFIL